MRSKVLALGVLVLAAASVASGTAAAQTAARPGLQSTLGLGGIVRIDVRARDGHVVRRIRAGVARGMQGRDRLLDGTVAVFPGGMTTMLATRPALPFLWRIRVKLDPPTAGPSQILALNDPDLPTPPKFKICCTKAGVGAAHLVFSGIVTEASGTGKTWTLSLIQLTHSTGNIVLTWTPTSPVTVDPGQSIAVTIDLAFTEVPAP